jgi:hypothetical protein
MPEFTALSWSGLSILVLVGLAVAAILLRSACDLTGVDPAPSWRRTLALVVIIGAADLVLVYLLRALVTSIAPSRAWEPATQSITTAALNWPILILLSASVLMPGLRLRLGQSLRIGAIFTLLGLLVSSVTGLLLVGVSTIVGGFARLA